MRKAYPLFFFAAVTLLAFWKVILHGDFTLLAGSDTLTSYYPWFDVAAYWLKKGVLILWDPYVYAGKVAMGEPQPGLYYPLNWLVMLLPYAGGGVSPDGMQALLVFNYFLAAYFFYLLARSMDLTPAGSATAGIAYAIGGHMAHLYGYANVLSGFVWLPLAVLFYRKALATDCRRMRIRWALSGGIALALSFLPGHHIPPIQSGLLLLLYSVFALLADWRKTAWKGKFAVAVTLAATAVTSILLTAVQWLPSAEWARRVFRWVGQGDPVKWGEAVPYAALQNAGNLNPQDALSLVMPYASVGPSIYAGPAVAFLALLGILFARGRDAAFFRIALFVYLFLSWGAWSALHGWLNSLVPGLWFAREVFYYLIPFQACLALLAGWGLDCLIAAYSGPPGEPLRVMVRRAGWVMAALVLLIGAGALTLLIYRELPMNHPYIVRSMSLATFLTALGTLVFMLHTGRIRPALFRSLIIALIVLDLSSHLSRDIPLKTAPSGQESTHPKAFWKETPIVEFLKKKREQEFFRIDDPTNILPINFGDVWRLESTMGHGATALVDYLAFRGTGWGPGSNASALLNARYILSRLPLPGMKKVFGEENAVYLNPRAVPRAFAVSRFRGFASQEELLGWLMSPLFAPGQSLLLTEKELARLPRDFIEVLEDERENFRVLPASFETSAEKAAARETDEAVRFRMAVYRAPWGWSMGDELSIFIRTGVSLDGCYLIFTFYPTAESPSRVVLRMERAGVVTELPVVLPGLQPGDAEPGRPVQTAVNLGALAPDEYRVSLEKTAECSANIDSLRVSRFPPDNGAGEVGAVEIASFRPNRLRLSADLRRPAFVVLSEVYYPGWEALVDGKAVPLLSGDYILRAVPVPAGKHEIILRFRPKSFQWGLGISLGSLVLTGVFLLIRR